ncbi:MAG: hypothetical protein ABIN94_05345 [Ferruginibacter sp.]
MEENEGLLLIHLVRDYYMNEFSNFSLGDISEDEKYALFENAVMGIMYAIVLNFEETGNETYLAGLIKAENLQSITGIIRHGYNQVN